MFQIDQKAAAIYVTNKRLSKRVIHNILVLMLEAD
jgi:hypothetical protein